MSATAIQYPFDSYHRVASYELDSFGHVNNAVYMNFLERARNDFLIQRGLSFNQFSVWKQFPVLTEARLEFKKPAVAGDLLHIQGRVSARSEVSFTLQYRIVHAVTGVLILLAETIHVFIDEGGRPIRIPALFAERFLSEGN